MRSIVWILVIVVVVYLGVTVKLGERTFFGHVQNIWSSDETQDMVHGIKESSGPLVERVSRGVKAGLEEARRLDAGGADAGVAAAAE
jgi:hypothetical protein